MLGIPFILIVIVVLVIWDGFVTVQQGTVAVVTVFGKYQRLLHSGLNFKIPFIERIFRRISVQNRAVELEFQAITIDQANVHFKAMLLYSVLDYQEETIKSVAFKFMSESDFLRALARSIEGGIRSFVATQKQAEILSLRKEIVEDVKRHLDPTLDQWGYHLIDLQLNDIAFDEEVTRSMAKVVASSNLRAAAENEGQALLITKTKAAEAEGNAIRIAAAAEREAAQLRGQGVALFRQEVARGMAEAAHEMHEAKLDTSLILFSMWTESLKHFAEQGTGNTIFLDGSADGMQHTLKQMMAMTQTEMNKKSGKEK
jgi:regulator of protease activity HflC (stomatin/prohibitin superfamily)